MFADRDGPSDLLDLTKPLPRVCLVDFGLARKPGCTGNGTLGYKTIEFLTTGRCSLQADWWALGTILYSHTIEVHTGDFRCPYLTLEELLALRSGKLKAAEAAERMAGRDLDWPLELSASIGPELKQLIQGLLHKDPLHRAGGEQVRTRPVHAHICCQQPQPLRSSSTAGALRPPSQLSSTCSDGSGDGCDCDCKDCQQAQADSDTAPATCVALACLPLSLGLSCGDHSTGRGFTCSAVNAAAAAGPSYPTAQPMAPLLSSLATPQGALRRTGVPLSFFPFPSSLGLSCGDHSTGNSLACEWGQGLGLSSLGHSAADLKLQFPELPSEEELDTAYCTLHLQPPHLVEG